MALMSNRFVEMLGLSAIAFGLETKHELVNQNSDTNTQDTALATINPSYAAGASRNSVLLLRGKGVVFKHSCFILKEASGRNEMTAELHRLSLGASTQKNDSQERKYLRCLPALMRSFMTS